MHYKLGELKQEGTNGTNETAQKRETERTTKDANPRDPYVGSAAADTNLSFSRWCSLQKLLFNKSMKIVNENRLQIKGKKYNKCNYIGTGSFTLEENL